MLLSGLGSLVYLIYHFGMQERIQDLILEGRGLGPGSLANFNNIHDLQFFKQRNNLHDRSSLDVQLMKEIYETKRKVIVDIPIITYGA